MLDRKMLRDLRRLWSQVLAIALVMASGIAVFVMALTTMRNLEETRDAYYERYRFPDVFAHVKRAPESLVARLAAIPGVNAVAPRVVVDVNLDVPGMSEPASARLVSLPRRGAPLLNDLFLQVGRLPAPRAPDEMVAAAAFAEAHALQTGDAIGAIINGRKRTLTMVGIAQSPEFLYTIPPGTLMPDNRHFGILWLGHDALASAYDLSGAFNDVSLSVQRGVPVDDVIAAVDRLLAPYGGIGAYARKYQTSDFFLSGEIDELKLMARSIPAIFLAVAAFLLNIVVSRLIATEREQVGLLKAVGYGSTAVGLHYLKLVFVVVLVATVVGSAVGTYLAGVMTNIYGEFFDFPLLLKQVHGAVLSLAITVGVVAGLVGGVTAVWRAVQLPPAEAMRSPAPTAYYKGWFDFLGIARLLRAPGRMVIRHLTRWPFRSALTSLGIAMAVALLVSALHWLDSIEMLIEVQFERQARQDITLTFVEPLSASAMTDVAALPGVLAVEPYRAVPTMLRAGHRSRREAIIGLRAVNDLSRVLDTNLRPIVLPKQGLVLSSTLAEALAVSAGDIVSVEVLEARRTRADVRVAEVIESYVGAPAYMEIATLNALLREGPQISGANLIVDGFKIDALYDRIKTTPMIAGTALLSEAVRPLRETLAETITIMVTFYVGFASVIAFGVVYNSARISLSERARVGCDAGVGFLAR
ncbi:MAG: ABC transporter permease [Proteobacteria bacterium]|nr:ABC transporter permease [Pseudomonadota bacterium]MDA1059232.1 ABC transporter permease [Pseudomonadota bacterium]